MGLLRQVLRLRRIVAPPPQLEDLPARSHIEHMLGLVGSDVTGRPADRQRRSPRADLGQAPGLPVLAIASRSSMISPPDR